MILTMGGIPLHSKRRFSMFCISLLFLSSFLETLFFFFFLFLYQPTHLYFFLRFDTDDTLGALFYFSFPTRGGCQFQAQYTGVLGLEIVER